jgi:hypothetical protein
MGRDLRYALRALARSRTFAVSAALALGLAVGANAAIFGLIDGLWLRPPGVPRAGELTRIFAVTDTTDTGGWSKAVHQTLEPRRIVAMARSSRQTLDDGFNASPALAGREIYLRGRRHLYCIAESATTAARGPTRLPARADPLPRPKRG